MHFAANIQRTANALQPYQVNCIQISGFLGKIYRDKLHMLT